MSVTDPIADMLTRIRNGGAAGKAHVWIRHSGVCAGIAKVLAQEGFIQSFDVIEDKQQNQLRVELKYDARGNQVIRSIKRVSTPGRRVYRPIRKLPRPRDGMGISIVSTPAGVLSDRQARQQRLGGELLCTVE